MIWRVGTGFLVDGPYRLIDATGAITRRFEDYEAAYDFDVDRQTYVVRDGCLIEQNEKERLGWETSPMMTETVVLEGLTVDTSDEAARFVATVLGDRAVIEEETRIRDAGKE